MLSEHIIKHPLVYTAGTVGSDESAATSPYQPKAKRHKGEHKQKHKHKKKKSKKNKHKHKHSSKDFIDVESID